MEKRIERFRRQVEAYFGGRPGRGARYSEELRTEAVSIARDWLARGEVLSSIASNLSVGTATLQRWLDAAPVRGRELRPVEVVEVEDASAGRWSSGSGLVLITASGHRVEGLDLAEVALLLEALR